MSHTSSLRDRRLVHVVAMGLLATAAAFAQMPAQADPADGQRHGPRHGMRGDHGGMGMLGGLMHGRALDAVNATDEQRSQIKQIADAARTDVRAIHDQGKALREQARTLFTQPTVDARAAEALRVQFMAQHDAVSKRMLQAMLDVSRVLTPEQRTKLGELQAQRQARMQQHRGAAGR